MQKEIELLDKAGFYQKSHLLKQHTVQMEVTLLEMVFVDFTALWRLKLFLFITANILHTTRVTEI